MATIDEQFDAVIALMANRPAVFSAQDITEYADCEGLEDSVEEALHIQCLRKTVLKLDDDRLSTMPQPRYLGTQVVKRWWIDSTIRWARTDVDYVTSVQMARAMSSAFDKRLWEAPPQWLLDIGREWAMVANGCLPSTFVFPWASLLRSNPEFREMFHTIFTTGLPLPWLDSFLDTSIDEILNQAEADIVRARLGMGSGRMVTSESLSFRHGITRERLVEVESAAFCKLPQSEPLRWLDLTLKAAIEGALGHLMERESRVIELRFGLSDDGQHHTLEEIGSDFGVSRERIRQIEAKALRKLRRPTFRRRLQLGVAAEFMRSGGSLLVSESSSITPEHELLIEVLGLNFNFVKELGIGIMTTSDLSDYRAYLSRLDNNQFDYNQQSPDALLPFLSRSDANRVQASEEERRYNRARGTRSGMLYEALRSLGRAAHYQEIARECNRLFPDSEKTTHNWHAALGYAGSEEIGVVWIGRKGMYGLKEHGYSRPDMGLHESVAEIVERVHSETRQPVTDDVVMTELSKERRELSLSSVKMALSLNNRLEAVGLGRYLPVATIPEETGGSPRAEHDVSAAFEAFQANGEAK